MDDPVMTEALGELLIFGPVGVAALIVLAVGGARGMLSLRKAPFRAVTLGPPDLIVVFSLFFFGGVLSQIVLQYLGLLGTDVSEDARAIATVVQQLLLHGPAVMYVIVRLAMQMHGLSEWGLFPRQPLREVIAGAGGVILGLPLVLGLNIAMVVIGLSFGAAKPDSGHDLLAVMRDSESSLAVAVMTLSAVVIAPLVEEVLFRGLIQTVMLNVLGRRNRWLVLIGAAALFAAVHIPVTPWQTFAGLFILGLMFGWLYERYGSLMPGCIMHGLFNAVNVALVFVISDG